MTCSIRSALMHAHRKTVSVNGVVIGHDIISRETQNHPAPNPAAAANVVIQEPPPKRSFGCGAVIYETGIHL